MIQRFYQSIFIADMYATVQKLTINYYKLQTHYHRHHYCYRVCGCGR